MVLSACRFPYVILSLHCGTNKSKVNIVQCWWMSGGVVRSIAVMSLVDGCCILFVIDICLLLVLLESYFLKKTICLFFNKSQTSKQLFFEMAAVKMQPSVKFYFLTNAYVPPSTTKRFILLSFEIVSR